MNSRILDFYSGNGNSQGRKLEQIWSWDYEKLENVHDYIQWLFPLTEASQFNPNAPLLTDFDIQQFQTSNELKNRLLTSFKLMLQFYGLQCVQNNGKLEITPSDTFAIRKLDWLNWGDHNHLRITRILKSLMILGLQQYAKAFFTCLQQIYSAEKDNIDARSYEFWKSAVISCPVQDL